MTPAALLADIPAELLTLRDALAELPGLSSCQIGLEANISPEHYPLVRIVPARLTPGRPYGNRTCEVLLYFGARIANSQGLEEVYRGLFALEAAIPDTLRTLGVRYVETITDEDRLDTYKLMAIRAELTVETVTV